MTSTKVLGDIQTVPFRELEEAGLRGLRRQECLRNIRMVHSLGRTLSAFHDIPAPHITCPHSYLEQ